MESIKNIIFDFGGIIVDLDKQAAINAFKELGFHTEDYISDYAQSGIFSALESGALSDKEFYDFVRRQATRPIGEEAIRSAWNRMLTGIPVRRMQAIKKLRGRYHTYMLSNTNRIHWDYSCRYLFPRDTWTPTDCFDRIFLSFEIHLTKPGKDIFRHVLKEACLRPEETLFIDDSASNCTAAQELGLHTFHSQHPDDWAGIFK